MKRTQATVYTLVWPLKVNILFYFLGYSLSKHLHVYAFN